MKAVRDYEPSDGPLFQALPLTVTLTTNRRLVPVPGQRPLQHGALLAALAPLLVALQDIPGHRRWSHLSNNNVIIELLRPSYDCDS